GNVLSAFLNYAVLTGVGVSKAISTGNSAQTGIADYLAYFAADPETAVALVYLEGVADGRAFIEAVRRLTAAKPLVPLKAGVAAARELVHLPEDIRAQADTMVPSRWSRNNPIDLAGGETRDTIPEVLDLVCVHPEVDAVVFLGLGIQSNQAHLFRTGPFFPGHGLDRIAEFHERQDRRYAEAAREASERHGKPVLVATELVYGARAYGNAGPLAVREGGRVCYPIAHRAVAALRAM